MKAIIGALVFGALVACGGGGNTSAGSAGGAGGAGSTGSTAVSGSAAGFCSKVATYDAQFKNASPSADEIVTVYTDLVSSAPDEIKADLVTLRDYASTQSAQGSDSGSNESSQEAALAAAETASKNFTSFVKSACGLDLDSESTSSKFSQVGSSIN